MLESNITNQLKKTLKASIDNKEIAGANFMLINNGNEVFTMKTAWLTLSRDVLLQGIRFFVYIR